MSLSRESVFGPSGKKVIEDEILSLQLKDPGIIEGKSSSLPVRETLRTLRN